jgi:hypothetical protein
VTDFSAPINCSLSGPYLTATIQSLNSLGCLLFVYAVRYGKAIIVVPMVNGLFPLVTIVLSLLIYQQIPTRYNLTDMVWLSLPSSSWLSMKFATLPPRSSLCENSCDSAARDFASVEAALCRHLAGLGL